MRQHKIVTVMLWGLVMLCGTTVILGVLMISQGKLEDMVVWLFTIGIMMFMLVLMGGTFAAVTISDAEEARSHFCLLMDKAEKNPLVYRRQLSRLLKSGNLYIALLIICIGMLLLGAINSIVYTGGLHVITGLIILFVMGIGFILLKSIYLKDEAIEGHRLQRQDFPALFSLIDEACNLFNVLSFEEVYLLEHANCGVIEVPHRFWGNKQFLIIGGHLLEIFSQEELRAVLIHELAHVFHRDTNISLRTRTNLQRWTKIAASEAPLHQIFLKSFADYYCLRLKMHHAALAKQQEYIADGEAATHAGKEVFASALAKLAFINQFLLSPDSRLDLRDKPQPPRDYYHRLLTRFYALYQQKREEWEGQMPMAVSEKYDSHPSLGERLEHIGVTAISPLTFPALVATPRNEVQRLMEIMNGTWYSRAVPHWDNYTAKYRRSKEIIATYQPFDGAGEVEYGLALEYMERKEDALVVYTSVLAKDPQDAKAMFRKGMLLLDKQDDAGIDLVKAAMEADNSCIESGLAALRKYLRTHNMQRKMEALREWAGAMAKIANEKKAELENLHFSDGLVPAEADKDTVAKIQGIVGRHRSMKKTYLVRKSLKYSEIKLYVIGIAVRSFCSKKRAQSMLENIGEELQGLGIKFLLLNLKGNPALTKRITSVPDAQIS